ncbi:helicase-related protein [Aestuariivirga sp.]|uniref:helicase-related protein n=1 Tax=Aestuariivirga sp. TaxID=2650926 RepID=UPI003BAC4FE0
MPSPKTVTAVLGPTNTGKTHLAVERMLGHGGGMIGLPLRLLAREIYDRVRLKVGDAAVALVTGEEKIIPAAARYWVCTVEAMPSDVDVPFLAIDEVQLCADFERGHIFTDRVLHRRGREETMLLGAGTMRPILEKLIPGTSFVSRPRFSQLLYAGQKKITRLPRRSAIVAFSAEMVYATAELIRRQRGGAAVVLGALSPRTRNAQVALYQSGDVDYIVATDAIGMGLNMDVDHVAFASTRKFDGFQYRQLNPSELGQVAGRAGRYMNDGTFGVTGEADPFEQETVERLESHNFESVRMLQWRNRELDFGSLDRLKQSLGMLPRQQGLTRAQPNADMLALEALARDPATRDLATAKKDVERLWEVCQIPDYRNISNSEHASIVSKIYQYLQTGDGFIDEDWFVRQLKFCENTHGDLDTLSNRISHIRTWTFVANRPDWLKAPLYWQSYAREIEDKLSDALHERLTQRFIDRRTSVLMKRLAQKEELMSTVEEDGAIHVEGEYIGRIKGFLFVPDGATEGAEARALKAAALSAVAAEINARAKAVAASTDTALKLSRDGQIIWNHAPVGRLEPGATLLKPRAAVTAGDQLSGSDREEVQARLQKFVDRHIASVLEPLVKLEEGEGLEGISRGIAFRLVETLGVLPRDSVTEEVKSLSQDDRAKLRAFGARFGAFNVYVPALLKPAPTELRLLLWALNLSKEGKLEPAALPQPPGQGLTSASFDRSTPKGFYGVCGYRICGSRVVRIDMLERLADLIRDRVFWRARFPEEARPAGSIEGGGFAVVPDMMSLVGCSGEDFLGILRSLDYRMQKKKVKRPLAAAAVAATPTAGEEPGTPLELPGNTPSEIPPETPTEAPPSPEPPPPQPAEPPMEPPTPPELPPAPVETPPDLATPAAEEESAPIATEATAEATAAVEAATEEIEIEVWWPRDTGPFRHRPERQNQQKRPQHRREAAPQAAAPAAGEKPEGERRDGGRPRRHHGKGPRRDDRPEAQDGRPERAKPRHEERKPQFEERKPRPEKPIDPDSPFAVLGALKAKLAGK